VRKNQYKKKNQQENNLNRKKLHIVLQAFLSLSKKSGISNKKVKAAEEMEITSFFLLE